MAETPWHSEWYSDWLRYNLLYSQVKVMKPYPFVEVVKVPAQSDIPGKPSASEEKKEKGDTVENMIFDDDVKEDKAFREKAKDFVYDHDEEIEIGCIMVTMCCCGFILGHLLGWKRGYNFGTKVGDVYGQLTALKEVASVVEKVVK